MHNSIWVRRANKGDLDWIIEELKEFDRFAGTRHRMFPRDRGVLVEKLTLMIKEHLFLVAGKDSARVGFVGGFIIPHLFNPELLCLQETFWWVSPKHRGTSAGLRLLDAFDAAARSMGVDWAFFSLMHNSPVNDRCLTKRGYRAQETYYLREFADASSD